MLATDVLIHTLDFLVPPVTNTSDLDTTKAWRAAQLCLVCKEWRRVLLHLPGAWDVFSTCWVVRAHPTLTISTAIREGNFVTPGPILYRSRVVDASREFVEAGVTLHHYPQFVRALHCPENTNMPLMVLQGLGEAFPGVVHLSIPKQPFNSLGLPLQSVECQCISAMVVHIMRPYTTDRNNNWVSATSLKWLSLHGKMLAGELVHIMELPSLETVVIDNQIEAVIVMRPLCERGVRLLLRI